MLDLRLPIGLYFVINSVILVAVGLFQPHPVPVGAQMFNLDLIWGLVMGVFGLFMLGLSYMEKKSKPE